MPKVLKTEKLVKQAKEQLVLVDSYAALREWGQKISAALNHIKKQDREAYVRDLWETMKTLSGRSGFIPGFMPCVIETLPVEALSRMYDEVFGYYETEFLQCEHYTNEDFFETALYFFQHMPEKSRAKYADRMIAYATGVMDIDESADDFCGRVATIIKLLPKAERAAYVSKQIDFFNERESFKKEPEMITEFFESLAQAQEMITEQFSVSTQGGSENGICIIFFNNASAKTEKPASGVKADQVVDDENTCVIRGCFQGTFNEMVAAVRENYPKARGEYRLHYERFFRKAARTMHLDIPDVNQAVA